LWLFRGTGRLLAEAGLPQSWPRSRLRGTALHFVHASVNQLSFPCNMAGRRQILFLEAKTGISMIFSLFRKKNHNQTIVNRQYDALTSAARTPFFYSDLDVPDTVMGRFEMLSIVMILFFRRTAGSQVSGQELAQEIVDAFFQDIDHSIRELGIGDKSVPKRMKKLAGMFYGRLETYAAALEARDGDMLAEALRRNIYPQRQDAPDMRRLGEWMIAAEAGLKAIPEDEISRGQVVLLSPGE
jgi:cytochrome b pre-mRNA-processing protein 3